MGVVGLVVRVQRRRAADDLLVAAVTAGGFDPNGDRLVGLVGDDEPLADLRAARGRARPAIGLGGPRSARTSGLGLVAAARALRGLALALLERSAWRSSGVRGGRLDASAWRAWRALLLARQPAAPASARLGGGLVGRQPRGGRRRVLAVGRGRRRRPRVPRRAGVCLGRRLLARASPASRRGVVSSSAITGSRCRCRAGARWSVLGRGPCAVAHARGVLQLAGGVLEAQAEELAPLRCGCARRARRR